jgi:uncharacterized RDD family membrane protein YckC
MDWFYSENGDRRGPVPEATLLDLARGGKLPVDTLVWREGWSDWRPFAQAGLTEVGAGTAACVECGKTFPMSEMINYEGSWICPTCKPIFFQRVKEGVTISSQLVYAGFWVRFLAKFVDGIILQIANFGFQLVFMGGSFFTGSNDPEKQMIMSWIAIIFSMTFTALYSIFFVGKFGATPGKMALRLRIVTADGGKVSYPRATGRYFAEFLSSLILLIGYIMAAFDEEKRALHDRICDTRVIRLNA